MPMLVKSDDVRSGRKAKADHGPFTAGTGRESVGLNKTLAQGKPKFQSCLCNGQAGFEH